MDNIKSLQEKLGRNAEAMKDYYAKAEKDGREFLNEDEEIAFNRILDESNAIEEKIKHLEKVEQSLSANAETLKENAGKTKMSDEEYEEKYSKAFDKYIRNGAGELSSEERTILSSNRTNMTADEARAQTITTTGGGYLIPKGFQAEVDKALAAYGGIRSISRVLKTASGNQIEWPTVDDTSNTGSEEGVNDAVAETDITYGQKLLDAYIHSSDVVKIPWALMQDSAFDMESHAGELLGERLARGMGAKYITGSGSSTVQGIEGAATEASGVPSGTTALTSDNIYDVKHSVDPAYRALGAHFLFNDTTLKTIKKLSVGSSDDRPLWVPGLAFGEPSTIDGDPYAIDQNVADPLTAGNKFLFYGCFQKYVIREVGSPSLVVLRERYADNMQTGMFMWQRHDAELIQNDAVVYLYDTAT